MAYTGAHNEALDSYSQAVAQHAPFVQRSRVELLCNQLQSKLRLKDKDLEECVKLWTEAIAGAKLLQSEQRYAESVSLYETMLCVWPGEARIANLRDLIVHW